MPSISAREMIVHSNRRIRDFKLKNVVTVLAAPDDLLLPDASINRFFICDTWHHVENRAHYLGSCARCSKRGGEVVMIDFKKEKTPVGPPLEMRIDRDDLVRDPKPMDSGLAAEHTFRRISTSLSSGRNSHAST